MENYNGIKTTKEEKRTEFKTYYEIPTQVMFYDADTDTWFWGIAYRDEIICTCCGSVLPIAQIIDDFNDYAKENGAKISIPIYKYDGWCDLFESICGGGGLPEDLECDEDGGYMECNWEEDLTDSCDVDELIDKRFLR